jgi:plastocyanin
MHRFAASLVGVALVVLQSACADRSLPTPPESSHDLTAASTSIEGGSDKLVSLLDACDPASFAAVGAPCARPGGRPFSEFIAEVISTHQAGGWAIAPSPIEARVGQRLVVVNRGGEFHTFTEVAQYGDGSINKDLNHALGDPAVAPECNAADVALMPSGGTQTETVDEEGTELYQCCIHPWMRATVVAKR